MTDPAGLPISSSSQHLNPFSKSLSYTLQYCPLQTHSQSPLCFDPRFFSPSPIAFCLFSDCFTFLLQFTSKLIFLLLVIYTAFSLCTSMFLPDFENFDFFYTYFCLHLPHISERISYKKHKTVLKSGAFYDDLLKNHPIYVELGTFVCDETPQIAIPKFAKRHPKCIRHIIRIPCQCENIHWSHIRIYVYENLMNYIKYN